MQSEETLVPAHPPVKYYFTRNSVRNTTIYVPSAAPSTTTPDADADAHADGDTGASATRGREVMYTVTTDKKTGKRTELRDARGTPIALWTRVGFIRSAGLKGGIGKAKSTNTGGGGGGSATKGMGMGVGVVGKDETITWLGRGGDGGGGDLEMPASKWLWRTTTAQGITVHVVDTPHGALVWRSEEDGAPHRHAAYLAPDPALARPVAWLVPHTETSSLGVVVRACAEVVRDEVVLSAIVLEQRMRVGRVAIGVFEQGRL